MTALLGKNLPEGGYYFAPPTEKNKLCIDKSPHRIIKNVIFAH